VAGLTIRANTRVDARVSYDKMVQRWKSERSRTKTLLSYVLAVLFPSFPIVYVLGLARVLDRDGVVRVLPPPALPLSLFVCLIRNMYLASWPPLPAFLTLSDHPLFFPPLPGPLSPSHISLPLTSLSPSHLSPWPAPSLRWPA